MSKYVVFSNTSIVAFAEAVDSAVGSTAASAAAGKENFDGVLAAFLANTDKVFALSGAEVEALFSHAIIMLRRVSDAAGSTKRIVAALTANPAEQAPAKLATLQLLLSTLAAVHPLRASLTKDILALAQASGQQAAVVAQAAAVPATIAQNADADAAALYALCAEVYAAVGNAAEAQQFRAQHLAAAAGAAQPAIALEAALYSIKAPAAAVCLDSNAAYDALLAFKGVQALAGTPATAPAVALLTALASGTCAEFATLAAAPATVAFAEANKVDLAAVGAAVRALSVAQLVAPTGAGVKSFAEIAAVLAPGADDLAVEEAVVEAVAAGVIGAKLNQKDATVRFEWAKPRAFLGAGEKALWAEMRDRVAAWRVAVEKAVQAAPAAIAKQNVL